MISSFYMSFRLLDETSKGDEMEWQATVISEDENQMVGGFIFYLQFKSIRHGNIF